MLNRALPWLALIATLIIWAGYLIVTRAAMSANLGPIDVGLLRSLPAALILIPFTLRHGLLPEGASFRDVFAIAILGGTAFIILLSLGLRHAPVADSGIFTPSILPVWMAILGFALFGETRSRSQLTGIALIVFGALAIGGLEALSTTETGTWRGHIMFLIASSFWAIYTLVFGRSHMTALGGTALMVTWASILFLLMLPFTELRLFTLSAPMLTLQVTQGIASGLIANLTFLYAVRRLGHVIPSASAAAVPILAALGGWLFLGETLSASKAIGIMIVALGILLASGIVDYRRRRRS